MSRWEAFFIEHWATALLCLAIGVVAGLAVLAVAGTQTLWRWWRRWRVHRRVGRWRRLGEHARRCPFCWWVAPMPPPAANPTDNHHRWEALIVTVADWRAHVPACQAAWRRHQRIMWTVTIALMVPLGVGLQYLGAIIGDVWTLPVGTVIAGAWVSIEYRWLRPRWRRNRRANT